MAIGKFHGVMTPMTPTASRVISTETPGRVEARRSPERRSASPAKYFRSRAARAISAFASGRVLPSSRASRSPSSSTRARIVDPARSRISERYSGVVLDQAAKAFRAAATASWTSSAVPQGASPITSSVFDGLMLGTRSRDAVHCPSMKCRYSCTRLTWRSCISRRSPHSARCRAPGDRIDTNAHPSALPRRPGARTGRCLHPGSHRGNAPRAGSSGAP